MYRAPWLLSRAGERVIRYVMDSRVRGSSEGTARTVGTGVGGQAQHRMHRHRRRRRRRRHLGSYLACARLSR
jgi:hypothetical protein